MHTPLCRHATGPMHSYAEHAREIGLREIGFSDHNPLPGGRSAGARMAEAELESYVQCVLDLQSQYRGQIGVLLGLEMDYLETQEDYLHRQLKAYPWDFVIGSVHFFDDACQLDIEARDYPGTADEQYVRYFELVRRLARSGLCDIIGHLDLVKRSGRVPTQRGLDEVVPTLAEVARAGLTLEINTSGYRHTGLPVPQPYPSLPIVEQAMRLGIPLVVNSDAHAPTQVGLAFVEVGDFLVRSGCQQLCRFARRARTVWAP